MYVRKMCQLLKQINKNTEHMRLAEIKSRQFADYISLQKSTGVPMFLRQTRDWLVHITGNVQDTLFNCCGNNQGKCGADDVELW